MDFTALFSGMRGEGQFWQIKALNISLFLRITAQILARIGLKGAGKSS